MTSAEVIEVAAARLVRLVADLIRTRVARWQYERRVARTLAGVPGLPEIYTVDPSVLTQLVRVFCRELDARLTGANRPPPLDPEDVTVGVSVQLLRLTPTVLEQAFEDAARMRLEFTPPVTSPRFHRIVATALLLQRRMGEAPIKLPVRNLTDMLAAADPTWTGVAAGATTAANHVLRARDMGLLIPVDASYDPMKGKARTWRFNFASTAYRVVEEFAEVAPVPATATDGDEEVRAVREAYAAVIVGKDGVRGLRDTEVRKLLARHPVAWWLDVFARIPGDLLLNGTAGHAGFFVTPGWLLKGGNAEGIASGELKHHPRTPRTKNWNEMTAEERIAQRRNDEPGPYLADAWREQLAGVCRTSGSYPDALVVARAVARHPFEWWTALFPMIRAHPGLHHLTLDQLLAHPDVAEQIAAGATELPSDLEPAVVEPVIRAAGVSR